MRVGVRVHQLPDTAILRFFAPGSPRTPETTGAMVNASVRQNRAAGATSETAETYWSPLIQGEALTLEIELPAGVDPRTVRIALPRLSHLFRLPFAEPGPAASAATTCHQDPPCEPAWDQPSRATALLPHTDASGATGVCTATLLNDAAPSTYIPFLLTAQHCLSEQTRASSIEAVWFHRADNCGGPSRMLQSVSGGADLLYAAKSTDTSLLRLRQPPPAGAVFSGWSTTLPPLGTAVIAIHYQRGARQAIARGRVTEYLNCADVDHCADDADPDAIHYLRVTWSSGFTDPGGSGSGLFLESGQLVGTLSGGFSDCDHPQGPDDYGRFDLAYRERLRKWIGRPAAAESISPATR